MKKKDLEKTKNKTIDELKKDLTDLQEKLWQTQNNIRLGKEKNVRMGRRIRKDMAQILTAINTKN
ncbi:MAG: hypothetical protein COU06_01335 [Candidatus Harrisonbacteria bacterium CG10_big_fil_rev_8_21_14_0_10_38_8]|uniref:Large ribosomal subunit protein uL29 n=1 Tax=Candidatus Harrisonbacteria bacterium CG10_big_fil_rev_8_21_14_0_10_38_8 TaxID=1974582 RepID=A0A2M6WK84_9BACT|nr:MAG: hypothetical protein COU06_01335 [Candidatus Harrisonbacteria bacterium CG10_big_fil_rev_8_21_14_0_10_38_8]